MSDIKYAYVLSLIFNLFTDTAIAAITKYYTSDVICNRTIRLGVSQFAGIMYFSYESHNDSAMYTCRTIISTRKYSQIAFKFQHPIQLSNTNSYPEHACNNALQVKDSYNSTQYCVALPTHELITEKNQLSLTFTSRGKTSAKFKLIFNTFAMSPCFSHEVKCDNLRCIKHELACSEIHNFCGDNTHTCADIVTDTTSTGLTTGITVTAFIIFIIVGGLYVAYKNRRTRQRCCLAPPRQAAPRTADDVYTISGDNSDSETGPIDNNQFAPPPEYSSLENIQQKYGEHDQTTPETDGAHNKESDDPPPYQTVISHQEEYHLYYI